MALKRTISKDVYEKLADNIKFEYAADGENFTLQTEGDEDTGALKRANIRLKDQLAQSEVKNDELAVRLDAIEKNPARKAGDIDAITRQLTKEKDDAVAEVTGKLDKANARILSGAVENVARGLAEKISTAPGVMLPHVTSRLHAELDADGAPVIKVKDAAGKVADALTVDKLGEEFVANKDFSGIIRVTKASGGAGASHNGGAVNNTPRNAGGNEAPNLASMNPKQLAEHMAAKQSSEAN